MTPPWREADVRQALNLEVPRDRALLTFAGISTDTRSIAANSLFVALQGERFDGHDHLAEAAAAGATGAVVRRSGYPHGVRTSRPRPAAPDQGSSDRGDRNQRQNQHEGNAGGCAAYQV